MIEQLLQRVARALEDHRIDYMVIGEQAVLIYGRVRVTRDIDITLGFGVERLADMLRVCKESGLRVLSEKPQEFAIWDIFASGFVSFRGCPEARKHCGSSKHC